MNLKKFLAFVLAIPLFFLTAVPGSWAAPIVEYINEPLPHFNETVVDDILDTAGDVNEINIAFWTLTYGPVDAAQEWVNGVFGDPEDAIDRFHEAGINVLIAAGGSSEAPVNSTDAHLYGLEVANFAKNNHFDGVDFDIENFGPGEPDSVAEWLGQATQAVKDVYPDAIVSHAPQAPYFEVVNEADVYGYLTFDQLYGDLVDHYNIQYYNQGDEGYDSYEELFIHSETMLQPETAVAEIAANGVPLDKIVIGKIVTQADGSTGYVAPEELAHFICKGVEDGITPGGVMGWKWNSDYQEQQNGAAPWSSVVAECLD